MRFGNLLTSVTRYVLLYICGALWDTLFMTLSEQERAELHALLTSSGYDRAVSSRAQMVLWYDAGYRKVEIATMSGASRPTVDKWLKRYAQFGREGLVSDTSPRGPRQIPDRIRGRVLALSRTTPPVGVGHLPLVLHGNGPLHQEDRRGLRFPNLGVTALTRTWRDTLAIRHI